MAPNKKKISNIGQEAFGLLDEQQLYATKGKYRSRAPPPPSPSSSVVVKTINQKYFYYNSINHRNLMLFNSNQLKKEL
ncbi:hypothetical protein RDI58_014068 [Solanum bulbocastanum]|uniref:Uncharacterized protein n=1 Tax=Solanum bulbocastanum TaxID=147425 RepID=A0AAN8TT44_SOLBU